MHAMVQRSCRVRTRPAVVAVLLAAVTGLLTSCGLDAQTLQPYTPALGINVNVGADHQVKVRNLMLITDEGGRGVVSATVYAERPDALTTLSGAVDAMDGDGQPLTAFLPAPVTVPRFSHVILTDLDVPLTLTGPGLRPGLAAEVTLGFRDAGSVTVIVPIMSTDISYLDDATEFETIPPADSSRSASPAYNSLKMDIFVDAESVRPVNKSIQLDVGQTVSLLIRSDHDVSVHLEGPELDEDVFVARLATIPFSFVVDRPGTVVITTDDPAATIATLTVE